MIFLKLLSRLIKVMRADASPRQIGWGFALGAVMGLTPLWNLHNLLVLLLAVIFPVNLTAAVLGWIVYGMISPLLDPLFHTIGYALLVEIHFLQPVWTALYNTAVVSFSRFNNTVVLGSLAVSLVLLWPNALIMRFLVSAFRTHWTQSIEKWKVIHFLKGNKLVRLYVKIRDLGR